LLIGEVGMHLEVHFIAHGLGSTYAPTASACVDQLKKRHFDFLVLPPTLPDSTPDMFSLWVLQHYNDVVVLLYRDEPEGEVLGTFAREGRFVRVPLSTQSSAVAQWITQSWTSKKPIAQAAAPLPRTGTQPKPIATAPPRTGTSPRPISAPSLGPLAPEVATSGQSSPWARTPAPTAVAAPAMPDIIGKPTAGRAPALMPIPATPMAMPPADPFAAPSSTLVLSSRDMVTSREAAAERDLEQERMQRSILEQELAGLRDEVAKWKSERDAAVLNKSQNDNTKSDAIAARDRMAASLREAEAARDLAQSHYKKAEDARERTVVEVRTMQRDLDIARADVATLRTDYQSANREIATVREANTRLMLEAEQHLRELVAERERRESVEIARTGEQGTAAKRIASLEEKLGAREGDVKGQAETIAKLEKARAVADKALVEEKSSTADEKKLREHNQRKAEQRAAQLEKDLEVAEKKIAELRDEVYKSRQLRDDAEIQMTNLESEIVEARAASREAGAMKAALDEVKSRLAGEQKKSEGLERELGNARLELDRKAGVETKLKEREKEKHDVERKLENHVRHALDEKHELEERIAELEGGVVSARQQGQQPLLDKIASLEAERDAALARADSSLAVDVVVDEPEPEPEDPRELMKLRAKIAQIEIEKNEAVARTAALEKELEKVRVELDKRRAEAATAPVLPKAAAREARELEMLEQRLEEVTRERDQALSALTEAGRRIMMLEDEVA
jgi:colicin import membrane protein